MNLSLSGVSVTIDSVPIVTGVELEIRPGEKVALVGPNGSGKTTFLRTIYRSVRPSAGAIIVDGRELATLGQKEVARRAALVAQESASDFDFRVEDVVALGRLPHQRTFDKESDADRDAIAKALERTGMTSYRNRAFASLSGGEKQRVLDLDRWRGGSSSTPEVDDHGDEYGGDRGQMCCDEGLIDS